MPDSISAQTQQIDYKPLYTEESFNNRILDINLPVGTMAGEAGVANGAAMYHIPIVVPPGTNGVVPNLSINYNSMAGNGMLGRGWSLSGLSSISRVPGRLFYDDDVFPVNFDANDRFSLDGQHLIGLSGSYGSDSATYGTELEDYSVITSHGVFGSGPRSFTVETKQGVIYEYGANDEANDRIKSNDGQHVLEWKLSKVTYPDQNYILFTYSPNGKLITKISYTGNEVTQQEPFSEIEFKYKERSDKNTIYISGSAFTFDLLLTSIVTKSEGLVAGSYHFEYGYQDYESFLAEVERKGNDGLGFNSTVFRYNNNPFELNHSSINLSSYPNNDWNLIPADIYSNGFSDLLAIKNDATETTLRILRNNGSSSNPNYSMALSKKIPKVTYLYNNFVLPSQSIFYSSDITGNGRSDIILCNINATPNNAFELNQIRIYQDTNSNPDLFTLNNFMDHPWPSISQEGSFRFFQSQDNFLIQGDFDGDGRMDLILNLSNVENQNDKYKAFLAFPGKTGYGQSMVYHVLKTNSGNDDFLQGIWQNPDFFNVIDFTGDGRNELMITKGNETRIYRIIEKSGDWEVEELYSGNFPTKHHKLYFGDFNGDGKTDILFNYNEQWGIAYSTGINFNQTSLHGENAPLFNNPEENCGYQIFITDVSGNGKSDIVQLQTFLSKANGEYQFVDECFIAGVKVIYSTGDIFTSDNIQLQGYLLIDDDYQPNFIDGYDVQNYFLPLQCRGDGRLNFIHGLKNTLPTKLLSLNTEEQSQLLKAVKNGLNKNEQWTYSRMDQFGVYTRDSITSYPVNTIQAPMYLVSEQKTKNPFNSLILLTQFQYKNAKLHRQKGFLGFESVTSTNILQDSRMIQYQAFNPKKESLLPISTESYLKKGNGQYKLIRDVTVDFDLEDLNAKRYKMLLTQKTTTNYLSGSTIVEQILDYDNFGNPIEMETDINGIETIAISLQYGQFGTPVPAHVKSNTTTTTRTGQAPFTVETTMDYNNLGQLIEKVEFVEMTKEVISEYDYNNNGTIVSKLVNTIGSNGPETRTSAYEYDSYGRFIVSSENALNQTTFVATNDPRNGNVLSYTDIDGLQSTFDYDGFGRLLKTADVSKNYEVQETLAWSINSALKSIYKHTVQHPGHLNTTNYYDVVGRNVKKEAPGFLGTFLPPPIGNYPLAPLSQQLTTYGIDGSVDMQTRPHFQGEDAMPVTQDLDEYGRVGFVYSDYGTTEYAYEYNNGNETVMVTSPSGETTSTTTDATGKVIQVLDNGGTLNYEYFSHGGLRKVTQGSTTLVEMEYDEYGRQTKLIDGSAGTILYEYDGFGQLISQTNAKNEVQTMDYDLLGRVVTQTLPEGSIEYTYKNNAPGINLPEQVLGIDGGETHYSYDNFGRIASVEEIIDGESFTMHFEYNKYDRLKKRIFPTGYALRYFYDRNGNLSHIFSDDMQTQFYTAYESNGQGQMVNWTGGNGKSSEVSYYKGFPVNFTTTGVQDLDMQWEHGTGNLLQRVDNNKNRTEQFTYDNLDRLIKASVNNGQPEITLQYMPNGSPAFFDIPTIMNYGDYYNPGPKNAVVNAENTENIISTDIQHIQYTSFKQPRWIKENGYEQNFWYGSDMQRRKSVLKLNQQQVEERIYLGSYERVKIGTTTHHLNYVYAGGKLIAIVDQNRHNNKYYYTYTDHLGSIVALTDKNGVVVAEQNFDAWGNARNPDTWKYENLPTLPAWFNRGYTGHEHMPHFALINMNGRMYDPLLNRMLSPDNFVQAPFSTQNYNRYSYAFNNPLKYTDPDGEIVLPIFLYFTEVGYDIQKFILPVAYKVDLPSGTHMHGIGVQASFGIPQMVTYSARIHGSLGYYKFDYYSSDEPIPAGMQYTVGYEFGFAGLVTVGSTKYWTPRSPHLNQKLAHVRLDNPTFNIKYSNDMSFGLPFGDGGDRHRTAAFQARAGILSAGIKFFTGDPGLNWKDRNIDESKGGKAGLYLPNIFGDDPDQYRAGIGYIGIGPIKFGNDRESRRHRIQNELIHDLLLYKDPSPHFQVLDIPNRFYFQFLSGGGFLW